MPAQALWRFTAPPHPLIDAIPAFADNYLWLLRAPGSRLASVIDPGDAGPVLERLQAENLELVSILLTHHHADHAGGVAELCARTNAVVFGPAEESIAGVHKRLRDADVIHPFAPYGPAAEAGAEPVTDSSGIAAAGLQALVIEVPGHTRGHIAYWFKAVGDDPRPVLFCGDTLFAAGCGRVFEGTPAQMLASLDRLAALSPDTLVYCAHEYTVSNLKFGVAALPGLAVMSDRLTEAQRMREQGLSTVPSTIGIERAANPFLLVDLEMAQESARLRSGLATTSREAVFTALRDWKNHFRAT